METKQTEVRIGDWVLLRDEEDTTSTCRFLGEVVPSDESSLLNDDLKMIRVIWTNCPGHDRHGRVDYRYFLTTEDFVLWI